MNIMWSDMAAKAPMTEHRVGQRLDQPEQSATAHLEKVTALANENNAHLEGVLQRIHVAKVQYDSACIAAAQAASEREAAAKNLQQATQELEAHANLLQDPTSPLQGNGQTTSHGGLNQQER